MKARVNTFLNKRTGTPEILPNNNPNNAHFKPDDIVEIVDTIIGQEYKGNDVWHRLDSQVLVTNFGLDVDKNIFFTESQPLSVDNNLSKKIIINNQTAKNGRGITIGILDSGIDTIHPSLRAALNNNEINFLTAQTEIPLVNKHGTNVAGLICGNDESISGLTIDARIKSFRIIKRNNMLDEIALKKALDHILSNEADIDILNLSFEVPKDSFKAFRESFGKLIKSNIILVVAGYVNKTNQINSLAEIENAVVVGAFEEIFTTIPKAINLAFVNVPITTTTVISNHTPFKDSSAYTAVVTGIIGKFLSNHFIPKSKRQTEVNNYLKSASFNLEINKSPFKMYRNENF